MRVGIAPGQHCEITCNDSPRCTRCQWVAQLCKPLKTKRNDKPTNTPKFKKFRGIFLPINPRLWFGIIPKRWRNLNDYSEHARTCNIVQLRKATRHDSFWQLRRKTGWFESNMNQTSFSYLFFAKGQFSIGEWQIVFSGVTGSTFMHPG